LPGAEQPVAHKVKGNSPPSKKRGGTTLLNHRSLGNLVEKCGNIQGPKDTEMRQWKATQKDKEIGHQQGCSWGYSNCPRRGSSEWGHQFKEETFLGGRKVMKPCARTDTPLTKNVCEKNRKNKPPIRIDKNRPTKESQLKPTHKNSLAAEQTGGGEKTDGGC